MGDCHKILRPAGRRVFSVGPNHFLLVVTSGARAPTTAKSSTQRKRGCDLLNLLPSFQIKSTLDAIITEIQLPVPLKKIKDHFRHGHDVYFSTLGATDFSNCTTCCALRQAAGLGKLSVMVLPATLRVSRNWGSWPGSVGLAQWQVGLPQRRTTAVMEPGRRSPKPRNSSS